MSMGNNWIIRIDPNGGNDEDGTPIYPSNFVGPLPQGGWRLPVPQVNLGEVVVTSSGNYQEASVSTLDQLAIGALTVIEYDAIVLDPSDAVWVKWAAWGVIGGGICSMAMAGACE